jgi:AraC family transcriptional activator of pobA
MTTGGDAGTFPGLVAAATKKRVPSSLQPVFFSTMPTDSRRQIPRFDTLTTFVRDEEGSGFSFGDFAANIRQQPDRTRLHRHDFQELFYFHRGDGSHQNDFREFAVRSPALVLVEAGHVHSWADSGRLRGDMVSFDTAFALPRSAAEKTPALFLPPAPVVIPLNKAEAAAVELSFARIRLEWRERGAGWLRAVRSCLRLLHIDAVRAQARACPDATAQDSAAARLTREFLLLLEQNLRAEASPGKFATALNVSADHLSATLRAQTGKAAGQHLQDRLLLEARRLLAHSRLDVAEIAYELGYQDVSYFGRVFRRREGVSPGTFRKRFAQQGTQ